MKVASFEGKAFEFQTARKEAASFLCERPRMSVGPSGVLVGGRKVNVVEHFGLTPLNATIPDEVDWVLTNHVDPLDKYVIDIYDSGYVSLMVESENWEEIANGYAFTPTGEFSIMLGSDFSKFPTYDASRIYQNVIGILWEKPFPDPDAYKYLVWNAPYDASVPATGVFTNFRAFRLWPSAVILIGGQPVMRLTSKSDSIEADRFYHVAVSMMHNIPYHRLALMDHKDVIDLLVQGAISLHTYFTDHDLGFIKDDDDEPEYEELDELDQKLSDIAEG